MGGSSGYYIALLLPIILGIGLIKVSTRYENTVQLSKVKEAFAFIKDFRNFAELNPLITSIVIEEESPQHQVIEYEELYETLPSFMTNLSRGNFSINDEEQSIHSVHSTCLLLGTFYCLQTESLTTIVVGNVLKLEIDYDCPFALTPICREEIVSQQSKIMKKLKSKFN